VASPSQGGDKGEEACFRAGGEADRDRHGSKAWNRRKEVHKARVIAMSRASRATRQSERGLPSEGPIVGDGGEKGASQRGGSGAVILTAKEEHLYEAGL